MSADVLVQLATQLLYLLVFVTVLAGTVRRPTRANIDMTLMFAAISLAVAGIWLGQLRLLPSNTWVSSLLAASVLTFPYLLLRVVADFTRVSPLLMRGVEATLAVLIVLTFFFPAPRPFWVTLLQVIFFFLLEIYAGIAFWNESRRSNGLTRRRMQWVAFGSWFLGAGVLLAIGSAAVPGIQPAIQLLQRLLGLVSGIAYVLGFAPPPELRRAWQEPELRTFLGRVAMLPHMLDVRTVSRELEAGAAAAIGAPAASVVLHDDALGWVRPGGPDDQPGDLVLDWEARIAERASAAPNTLFLPDAPRSDPEYAAAYRRDGAIAVLASPIVSGAMRHGVLIVSAPRAPIFANDDLGLMRLLADQAAVVLENRAMLQALSKLRAREEADRLKEDFLSSAAHQLKTPLTSVLALSQLLARLEQSDRAGPRTEIVRRLIGEAKRLNRVVGDMLDASVAETEGLVGERSEVDIVDLAEDVCAQPGRERCRLLVNGPVGGSFDRSRLRQLIEHLIENALAFSPPDSEVVLRVWHEDGEARICVMDRGIGVPEADLSRIFERFQRGANVDDRRYAGTGLGLYLSRVIAEQHGGRIWAERTDGGGSTFQVALPTAIPVAP